MENKDLVFGLFVIFALCGFFVGLILNSGLICVLGFGCLAITAVFPTLCD